MNLSGIWQSSATGSSGLIQSQIPLSVIILLIAVISAAGIFFYRNRRLQMKLAIGLILLATALLLYLALFAVLIIKRHNVELVPVFRMIIPPLVLIFSVLAYRGIKNDENLVRSYDRLR